MNTIASNDTPRVLYIEDDESLAWVVAKRLKRHGFKVDLAGDGGKGLDMVKARRYDAILIDYKMPEMDGLEVLRRLLSDPASPPAIMVSGAASLQTAVEAMRLGAADYVIKEAEENYFDLLLVTLNRVLEKYRLTQEKERAEAELKESREQYRRILETTNFIPWEFDLPSDGFTYMGPQVEQLLGYPADSWTNLDSWSSRIYREDREQAVQYCSESISKGEDHDFEYRFLNTDGRVVWIRDVVNIVRDDAGNVTRLRGFFIDISEQKRQEETIRKTNAVLECESRIQSLFIGDSDPDTLFDALLQEILKITQSAYGYIASLDREENGTPFMRALAISNVAWNDETRRFYQENAPTGMKFHNFKNLIGAPIINGAPVIANDPANHPQSGGLPEGNPPLDAFLGMPLWRGKEIVGTFGLANRPGGYDEEIVPLLQPILAACVQIMDGFRTEMKQQEAEKALRNNEALLRSTMESTNDGILVVDQEGKISQFNRRFADIWRIPETLLETREDKRFLEYALEQLEDPAAFLSKVQELYQSTRESFDTLRFKDGRIFERYSFPVFREGKPSGRGWNFRDVSQRERDKEALQHSEERLRTIVENMPIMMDAFDEVGNIIAWNRESERVTGYSGVEIIGNPRAMEMLYPDADYRQRMQEKWRRRGNDYHGWEWDLTTKDGEVRTIAWSNRSDRFSIAGWTTWGVGLDITDRKRAEAALLESQGSLAKAQEIAHLGSWDWNPITGELLWSDEVFRLFGLRRGEFKPDFEGFLSLVHPDDRSMIQERVARTLSEPGNEYRMEYRHLRSDGSVRFLSAQGEMTWSEDGQPLRLFGTVMDITERKKRETALAESELLNRMIVHAAQVAVWDWDLANDVTIWNEKLIELFGHTAGRVENSEKWWMNYIHPEDYQRVGDSLTAYLETGDQPWHEEYRFKRADGQWATVIDWGVAIKDDVGKPVRMVGAMMDISQRKRLEEALQQAKEQAETANTAKSAFLAAMSHDIRTPMNAILGMGEVLKESGLNREQEHALKVLTHAGENLLALINDILDLSKVESGQLQMEALSFDLHELTRGTHHILKQKALAKGIVIDCRMQPDCPRLVVGDPQRLRQVLLNLLGNAIKFTDKGEVSIAVANEGEDRIQFSVTDTGIGIPEKQLEKIFDPFRQAEDSTSRRFGGTGLGLSICKRLVQAMRGEIEVESRLGSGSVFRFTAHLPRAAHAARVVETTRKEERQGKPDGKTPEAALRILLVDDAEDNRMVISAFFRKTPHRITEVVNGEEAMRAFQSKPFDLVLMDMQMPVLNGFDATRRIRAWEREQEVPPTPIVALTANAMKEDIKKTSQAGCDLHLSKPVRKTRLMEVVNRIKPKSNGG